MSAADSAADLVVSRAAFGPSAGGVEAAGAVVGCCGSPGADGTSTRPSEAVANVPSEGFASAGDSAGVGRDGATFAGSRATAETGGMDGASENARKPAVLPSWTCQIAPPLGNLGYD
jgi:hypothetical protein